jgi:hypothetical protein
METKMNLRLFDNVSRMRDWVLLTLALIVAAVVATGAHAAAPPGQKSAHAAAPAAQKSYASPEEAVTALVDAVRAHDRAAILGVVGNAGEWISSGDAVADRATGDRFVAAYDAKHSITRDGDTAKLVVGNDDFPFAFPIVKTGERWRFDTNAGKDELLARRIGENELYTINVLQAIGDAQRDYASADRNGDGVLEYAQKFASTPGKHDGLYWPVKAGEPPSPLGEFVADAAGQGYKKGSGPQPFHGYHYRMLKGQGKNAPSGALDYVVHGRAIGGFAVVAYPARYANSGIMTFIINQDGKVYEADLGRETQTKASAMQLFDPGKGWSEVKSP